MVVRGLLLLTLAGPVWAQNPQMVQLRDLVRTTLSQAPPLESDRQAIVARLELLTIQADNLARGGGDWNVFFRFYQETQAVMATSGPLPGTLAGNWAQIQDLVSNIARQQGRSIGIVGEAYQPGTQVLASSGAFKTALQAAQRLESALGPPPPGADSRYLNAKAQLEALRNHLQNPKNLAQIIQDRRRFQVIRSALQLSPARFAELDQALDQLPAP